MSTDQTLSPRVRWAAIIWGIFFAAIAWTGLWLLSDTGRQDDVTNWMAQLTPNTITAFAVLSLGVFVLVAGLVGLIRHAQRRITSATAE